MARNTSRNLTQSVEQGRLDAIKEYLLPLSESAIIADTRQGYGDAGSVSAWIGNYICFSTSWWTSQDHAGNSPDIIISQPIVSTQRQGGLY
jgi:hypothetical protein